MIATRPATPADRDFIVSGWSASLRSSRDIPLIPMTIYADTFRPIIERLLDRCNVIIAHGDSLPFGFIAFDPSTYVAKIAGQRVTLDGYILYVYVASPYRRSGVARRLFSAAGISPTQRFGYACRTRSSWAFRSKIPLAEYEPFRARYGETQRVQRAEPTEAVGSDPGPHDLAP